MSNIFIILSSVNVIVWNFSGELNVIEVDFILAEYDFLFFFNRKKSGCWVLSIEYIETSVISLEPDKEKSILSSIINLMFGFCEDGFENPHLLLENNYNQAI